jgi:opacity protein-like surface antigen
MRRLPAALGVMALGVITPGLIAAVPPAFAQEFELPALYGPQGALFPPAATAGWGGFYIGGQVGYSAAGANFANAVNDLSSFIMRDSVFAPIVGGFTTLGKSNANGTSYGWFAGYNSQWEGALLGLEVNYNRTALNPEASDSVSLRIANDTTAPSGHHFFYDPFIVSGSAGFHITDIATVRARAGWTAGQFMPYAFLGAAVVRADVTRSATVSYTRTDVPDPQTPPNPPLTPMPTAFFGPVTQTSTKNGAFYFGYAAGAGIEICVMPNVFVRGEWEFVDAQSMHANINSARTAIGVKF